ncbi:hypothetical protein JTE90_013536 [Oedothorax gibbosus]|uniref:Uncharacterized protein n=1 Tax=Oedothorax gibbosus TaxID=931172 RepID=A0AAV6U8U4_9ARAC|nr:hypothetical protein JTE90_013536 [Oedothorax gibbosus]
MRLGDARWSSLDQIWVRPGKVRWSSLGSEMDEAGRCAMEFPGSDMGSEMDEAGRCAMEFPGSDMGKARKSALEFPRIRDG